MPLVTRRLALGTMASFAVAAPRSWWAFVGTMDAKPGSGIHAFGFNNNSGTITPVGRVVETPSPAFLARHPRRAVLYAVNEAQPGGGAVSAFRIDTATGQLTLINQVPCPGGPAHLSVDARGRRLLTANYGGATVHAFALENDGTIGSSVATVRHTGSSVNPQRQREPHPHAIEITRDQRHALVPDLGTDKLVVYRLDEAAGLARVNDVALPPGSGPRHVAITPDGRRVYLINELNSTVTALRLTAGKAPEPFQTVSTLPSGFTGPNTTAEVQLHPSGRFLYGSNRGHDSIAVFQVDRSTGNLTATGHTLTGGTRPRHFLLDPDGRFLLAGNQGSDRVAIFRIDSSTGSLTATGQGFECPAPSCVLLVRR